MAGRPVGLCGYKESIRVTIGLYRNDVEEIARGLALEPELLSLTAEEAHLLLFKGDTEAFGIHIAEHKHRTVRGIGNNCGNEPVLIVFKIFDIKHLYTSQIFPHREGSP